MEKSDLEKYVSTATQSSSMLLTNLNRAAELIQSFKQVAVDQTNEVKRVFALKSYLDEVLLSLHPKLKRTHHNIVVDGDENIFLNSYPGVLSQIATNLLMNTLIHAYEPDDKGNISFKFYEEGSRLIFKYTDDGRGINKDDLEKVFDPFFYNQTWSGWHWIRFAYYLQPRHPEAGRNNSL